MTSILSDKDLDALAAVATGPQEVGADIKFSDDDLDALHAAMPQIADKVPFDQLPRAKASLVDRINSNKGLPGWDAFDQEFKGTKVGQLNFLRKTFGPTKVEPIYSEPKLKQGPRGEWIKDPKEQRQIVNFAVELQDGSVTIANPKGFDWGDIPRAGAAVAEQLPGTMLGGMALASGGGVLPVLAAGAIGDTLASAGTQLYGAHLPGDENMTGGERLIKGGANVLAGAASEVVGLPAGRMLKALPDPARPVLEYAARPVNAALGTPHHFARKVLTEPAIDIVGEEGAQQVVRRPAKEALKEGIELSERTGIPLTQGQAMMSPTGIGRETVLRQRPDTAPQWYEKDLGRMVKMVNFAKNAARNILGPGEEYLGRENATKQAGTVYSTTMDGLEDKGRELFGKAFAESRSLTKDAPAIEAHSFMGAVDAEHTASSRLNISKSTNAIRAHAESIAKQIRTDQGGRLRIVDLQEMLAEYGRIARTGKGLDEGISPDRQVAIATKYKVALERDLDTAIQQMQTRQSGGQFMSTEEAASIQRAAEALRRGRDGYRAVRGEIDAQQNSLLQSAIDLEKAPEKFIDNLVTGYSDSETKNAMALLWKKSPATARQVSRAAFERQLNVAENATTNTAAGEVGVAMTPNAAGSAFAKTHRRMRVILEGQPESQAMLDDLFAVTRRLSARSGMLNSATEPIRMWNNALLSKVTRPFQATQEWLGGMGAREFSDIVNSPDALRAYAGMMKKSNLTAHELAAGMNQINLIMERDRELFSGSENEQQKPMMPAAPGAQIAAGP